MFDGSSLHSSLWKRVCLCVAGDSVAAVRLAQRWWEGLSRQSQFPTGCGCPC